jgi:hypothetical protein
MVFLPMILVLAAGLVALTLVVLFVALLVLGVVHLAKALRSPPR